MCLYRLYIWRPRSLSELTPIIFNMELTHLGSVATIVCDEKEFKKQHFTWNKKWILKWPIRHLLFHWIEHLYSYVTKGKVWMKLYIIKITIIIFHIFIIYATIYRHSMTTLINNVHLKCTKTFKWTINWKWINKNKIVVLTELSMRFRGMQ